MYRIIYSKRAIKELNRLNTIQKDKIILKIDNLSNNPYLGKPLTANFKGKLSYRIGVYRVVYYIDKNEINILRIRHRKNSYKDNISTLLFYIFH